MVYLQIAFGDDFEDVHKHIELKYAKGSGNLLFLLTHTLEGYGRVTLNPFLPVGLTLSVSYRACIAKVHTC